MCCGIWHYLVKILLKCRWAFEITHLGTCKQFTRSYYFISFQLLSFIVVVFLCSSSFFFGTILCILKAPYRRKLHCKHICSHVQQKRKSKPSFKDVAAKFCKSSSSLLGSQQSQDSSVGLTFRRPWPIEVICHDFWMLCFNENHYLRVWLSGILVNFPSCAWPHVWSNQWK